MNKPLLEHPIPDRPVPDIDELIDRARSFRLRMAVLDQTTQTALDATRDRYGRTVHHHEADAALNHRTTVALGLYQVCLAEHADRLLEAARSALDALSPASHVTAWSDLLDVLATSHAQIVRALGQPADGDSAAEREQHAAVWPHLALWTEYGHVAADLADQHHQAEPSMPAEQRRQWTERAQAARRLGALEPTESWYAADGRLITLAYLVEDDTSTVVALAGDLDAPGWEVIGHYDDESQAGRALPRAVPPGVLRPEAATRYARPEPVPERPVQELLQEVIEARTAGEVSEALFSAAQTGYAPGPLARLAELLATAAEFSHALGTVQGHRTGARLATLGRQLDFLVQEITDAAEALGATVAVLPPHRVPAPPRARSRPALDTTPPAPPARTTSVTARP